MRSETTTPTSDRPDLSVVHASRPRAATTDVSSCSSSCDVDPALPLGSTPTSVEHPMSAVDGVEGQAPASSLTSRDQASASAVPTVRRDVAAADARGDRRVYTPCTTRESWLTAGIGLLETDFDHVAAPLPRGIRVSVGFPRGCRSAIGQCFSTKASTDGTNHVFISPVLEDSVETLAVVCHELVHVVDDCRSGHRGNFARIAKALGLQGPMRATRPSARLAERLLELAEELGPYPHRALTPTLQTRTPDDTRTISTRMLKVSCPSCGYLLRTTRYWLESKGPPVCPDGTVMVRAEQ
jgi:hypothetical protein